MSEHRTAQQIAEAARDHIRRHDRVARHLGIAIEAVGPGTATLSMTVRDDMLNAFDICHGGIITTLADTAFALACNSHGHLTVAAGLAVEFIAPARCAERLQATAQEVATAGRSGVYDVSIENQDGRIVAVFRGKSARVSRPAVDAAGSSASRQH